MANRARKGAKALRTVMKWDALTIVETDKTTKPATAEFLGRIAATQVIKAKSSYGIQRKFKLNGRESPKTRYPERKHRLKSKQTAAEIGSSHVLMSTQS